MISGIRQSLAIVLSSALVLSPMVRAQQTSSNTGPIPPQILSAHTVFVSNGGGSNYFEMFSGGANRAYNTFYSQLKKTSHYELVSSPTEADLIFEIRAIAPAVGDVNNVGYNPQVVLSIRDPKTNAVLWTESANVRAIGTKKHRDKDFDQSVAVLVDKLGVVTGQPLTTAQEKAIASNSRMPTAAKVFIFAAIAGTAAGMGYVIYRGTHPPSPPPMPTLPSMPPFPY